MMKQAYLGFPVVQVARSFFGGRYSHEMTRKLLTRIKEKLTFVSTRDPMPWILTRRKQLDDFCADIDSQLWKESVEASGQIQRLADRKLADLNIDLGGGGNYPLLYFMVRKLRPHVVVETGVAVGFSSKAVLYALKQNGAGRLYSSDFPYFRIPDPEKYIGYIVDDDLKAGWTCLTKGDRRNLPKILSQVDMIDLFHYDSDKSYLGREWALELILPRMRKGGVIIMDDLNDNCYFEDLVGRLGIEPHIFEFHGKYVGLFYVP